jgi:putative membrane protein
VKASTAGEPVKPDFKRNHLLQFLLVFYLALWAALAISPLDRSDWLLENLLVFVFVGGLVATYRRFPLSELSYLLIALFLALHAVGAHYTYAKAPLGFWLKDAFDLSRNHFDRIVHFSFGLLLGYPIRETLLRVIKTSRGWIFFLAFHVVLAWSGLFELLESWVAQIVSPELGAAYLGTQGDSWDAQNDMTAALIGVGLCFAGIAAARRGADLKAISRFREWSRMLIRKFFAGKSATILNASRHKIIERPKMRATMKR